MKKILVVVDMQNDFIDGALGTPEAEKIVERVVEKIGSYKEDCIVATRDTHEDNYLECIQNFHTAQQGREYEYEHLLVYFTFRYFMRSYYDDNILNKAQFAVASILMIRDMDALRFLENGGTFSVEDRVAVAKLYSKEVEHSEENMEFLEEDFQFEDIFAPEQMIRQLFFAS